uniref:Uncharacterized protein n=1 Tax=Nelumbo nucifera TaxID=4432 RepID=A0A822YWY3_NELNU|nr:TPA_asm: hypothetical protein HUJ06_007688 [Nelumbo nucifera]
MGGLRNKGEKKIHLMGKSNKEEKKKKKKKKKDHRPTL